MIFFATPRRGLLRSPLRALVLVVGASTGVALPAAHAKQQQSLPAVFVREVRIDPLLASFGVDSAQLRRDVMDALRTGNRLAASVSKSTPALDIAVTILRSLTGAELEPNALVSLEVGRNLMEEGTATTLVWERRASLRSYPTWRALSDNMPKEVLRAVSAYVDSSRTGG